MSKAEKRARLLQAAAIVTSLVCLVLCINMKVQLKRERQNAAVWKDESIGWQAEALKWEVACNKLTREVHTQRTANAELMAELELLAVIEAEQATWSDVGNCRITFYCPCAKCCGKYANGLTATGTVATEGRTVAVDPKVIPLGSEVLIDGVIYIAEDTGVSGNAIDIYLDSHQDCLRHGMYYTAVKWRLSE